MLTATGCRECREWQKLSTLLFSNVSRIDGNLAQLVSFNFPPAANSAFIPGPGRMLCAEDEKKVKDMHRECDVQLEDLPISVKFLPSKDWTHCISESVTDFKLLYKMHIFLHC